MVVIVTGLPGSGKSYFAVQLADRIGAVYINSDSVRKEMFQVRTYTISEKLAVYDEMVSRMQAAVGLGKNVILDATFYKEKLRQKFEQSLPADVIIHLIEVMATESLIRKRLRHLRPDSEADFGIYQLIRDEWESIQQHHLTLHSTNKNIDEMLDDALEYIHYSSTGNNE